MVLSMWAALVIVWLTGPAYADELVVIKCVCDYCSETNNTCLTSGSCLTTLERSFLDSEAIRTRECIESVVDLMLCESNNQIVDDDSQYYVIHCCNYDMCNENVNITFPKQKNPSSNDKGERNKNQTTTANIVRVIVGLCSLIVLLSVVCIWRFRKANARTPAVREDDISSGGFSLSLMVQRTVARQISIAQLVGCGRYGQVYRATWNGQDVAVKTFNSQDNCSWSRETEVYQTVMLRHPNILGYIASDIKDNGICTQLWLITDYHTNGSLYDYLQDVILDVPELLKLASSAACGLAHLHMEIVGFHGKPAIAHRDIKSRNILVKDDGTCCIADLGLAARKTSSPDFVDVPTGDRVGTIRYLAPEFLEDVYTVTCFDGYKRGDVYAFGLVLWEMTRRCMFEGVCEEHELPYYDVVPSDPSVEDVYKVVCVDQCRPLCSDRWEQHTTLKKLSRMMTECWKHEPLARLTILRVKKYLQAYIKSANQSHA